MTATTYHQFLEGKRHTGAMSGFREADIPSWMFPFQAHLTRWAIEKGRCALFADCGLGKTAMQLVWADNISRQAGKRVLIVTPLAVGAQTIREAAKFGMDATRSRDGSLDGRLIVTNYERLHYFSPADFCGVVCDESSAIKNFNGERRLQVTQFLRTVPYRLLCTATAAPNDYTELGTSSEALGELGHMDMLNRFFRNDNNTSDTRLMNRRPICQGGPKSNGWRFKGHAEQQFWRWVCSWARACRKPSDIGFADEGFHLPELLEREHVVETRNLAPGMLFALPATNMQEERAERRRTIEERCEFAAEIADTDDPAVIWCHLNDEGNLLEELIPDGLQIAGSTSDEEKEERFEAFAAGDLRALIIKDKIGAFGLNWQHCAHVIRFATHSYESYYQAVRRCWRFGQTRPVTVDIISTEGEQGVRENLARKSAAADRMFSELVAQMNNAIRLENSGSVQLQEIPAWLS